MVFPLGKETPMDYLYSELNLKIEKNFIVTDDECKTNVDGIYAVGDIRKKKLKQVVTAASDGAIAATAIVKYLINFKDNDESK